MSNINVIKRDGKREPLDLSKFHKVAAHACEGLSGVSSSELELATQIQFFNNIKTTEIQETLIKAAADLISEESPNYQYVAGRLINYQIRKQLFNGHDITHIKDHFEMVAKHGYYDKDLLNRYTDEEWNEINSYINHKRDMNLTYAAMEQLRGKYLVKNRVTGEIWETPQIAFMLIAMNIFVNYQEKRMQYVKELYDALSMFEISLPTPIMAAVRTPQKQYSSCVLIDCDDSLDSINATAASIVKYVSQKAGIGVNVGRIRAINSPIRKGDTYHTGVLPFIKYFQSATKSCSQGSVRDGAATFYFPIWHLEAESLIVLKNNKGVEDNRARHVDYGVQLNKTMYERLINNENITLFSPSDVPDLYEAFFKDTEKFSELYVKYENKKSIRKKSIPAIELFSLLMQERKDTGRIYIQNVDNVNNQGSFIKEIAPIYQSNLCVSGNTYITVELSDGSISDIMIKDATTNMKVYSRNIKTGKNEFRKIENVVLTKQNAKVIKITDFKTGQSLICTPDHKVYTKNRGYVEAQELKENDELEVIQQ